MITIQVHGSGPSSSVEFGPSGLHFNRPCVLSTTFPSEGVDPSQLGGYLLSDDGPITAVPHKIIVRKRTITVQLKIAHFSTYGYGDNGESGNSDSDEDGETDEDIDDDI